ncbi:helix-turn-helix domain-containing protein [Intestinimonas timonensis]|uniref:helix-turn-helix domain-containing protein n=1 Tax=Intestinimonas timonensis TaxID=1689270 RepID=UPI003BF79D57
MSRYYTPRTLSQTWDCSPDVVYDLLRTGKLKGFRVGRHWRVSDEARLEYEQRKSDTRPRPSKTPTWCRRWPSHRA